MTEPITEVTVLSSTDRADQEALLVKADDLLVKTRDAYESVQQRSVEFAKALLDVRESKAWLLRGYHSWDSYLKEQSQKFGRGRASLYGYISTVERLLPEISQENLIQMGVTKAADLARFVKTTGRIPPEILLEAALDSTIGVEEFKDKVNSEGRIFPDPEKGKWFSLAGILTKDEQAEVEQAIEIAKRTDPPSPPEWGADVLLKFAREFMSSYAGGVE